jgi:hypothetical protein
MHHHRQGFRQKKMWQQTKQIKQTKQNITPFMKCIYEMQLKTCALRMIDYINHDLDSRFEARWTGHFTHIQSHVSRS